MLEVFRTKIMLCMNAWKLSFYSAVLDNVGGQPIFQAILAKAALVFDAIFKIIFELLIILERKESIHAQ
jgi:hypothetical protein